MRGMYDMEKSDWEREIQLTEYHKELAKMSFIKRFIRKYIK